MDSQPRPPAGINDGFADPARLDHYVQHFSRPDRILFQHRHRIVTSCRLEPGMVVADLGAGTGEMTTLIAPHVKSVLAIEIFPHFIDYLRRRMDRERHPNVVCQLTRPDELGVTPDSLDLILLCNSYHHLEFPAEVLKGMREALRSGGAVVLVELHPDPDPDAPGSHVRGDREAFCREFVAAGFERLASPEDFMEGAYLERFLNAK